MSAGRTSIYNRPLARTNLDEALDSMPDSAVEKGQTLRDNPADFKVEDKGAGLWLAHAKHAETEIQLSGRKLKDYRCDCPTFSRTEVCEHLAALLAVIHLRKSPKVNKVSTPRKQTISTKKLINSIDEFQLRDFVTEYARTHADFALDLKVRFAQELPLSNRFEQVIKNLLSRSGNTFSAKQAKRLSDALLQFAKQRELWMAEKAYLDIFELNTTLIPKLVVIINKANRLSVDLAEYVKKCIQELTLIVESSPPPVILERIETWATEETQRGAYFRNEVDAPLYLLFHALGTPEKEVEEMIERQTEQYGISQSRIASLMHLYYREDRTEDAELLLIKHLDQPELVLDALQEEVAKGNIRRAVRLAGAAIEHQQKQEDRLQLHRFIFNAAQLADQPDLLQQHAPPIVYSTGELDEISTILQTTDEAIEQATFSAILEGLPHTTLRADQKESLTARLQLKLSEFEHLEQLLYRSQSDSLIAEILPQLAGKLPREDFMLLLETKIRENLSAKFGNAPAQWVAKLLDDVARRSRVDLTSELVKRLRGEFKQRHALIDALDDALL